VIGGWFCQGRYEQALPWASPESAQAGGIFRDRPGARKCLLIMRHAGSAAHPDVADYDG